MTAFLAGLGIILAGGVLAFIFRGSGRVSALVGAGSVIAGAAAALITALSVLVSGVKCTLYAAWPLPMAAFAVEIDPLAAFFLCAILGLSILSSLYGWEYMRPAGHARPAGGFWLWFNMLVVFMALVVVARNAVLFLLAWEAMSVASFFLVAHESDQESVRQSAWTYLVATHLGSALLLVMFVLVGTHAGSPDFEEWGALRNASPAFLGVVFLLGLIGFGVKAGLYPLHVWLPEAHPAAPSHVSALMSGVMIKTGIYAIIRLVSMLGPPPAWWGWLVLGIGIASGVLGVVFALAQHDIKRLLAYHSVENIGIIAMGLGLGLLGWSFGSPFVMAAGFAGGLLHVVNHAIFKGLLFLSAGAVVQSAGCRNLEQMGGLLRRMPATGLSFLTGAVAISGLPPLNGFVSEFMIYVAAFAAVLAGPAGLAIPAIAVIGALALIGGLAGACFTKVFGIAFLGGARSCGMANARECGWAMRAPQLVLAAGCFIIPLVAPRLAPALFRVAAGITGVSCGAWPGGMAPLETALCWVSAISAALLLLWLSLALLRLGLLRARCVENADTWDCGFAGPTNRMQYTASSFAQPITGLFRLVLGLRIHADLPSDPFPAKASFESHARDTAKEYLFRPAFKFMDRTMARLRWLQEGRVQVYVLYVAVTLLVLLLVAL